MTPSRRTSFLLAGVAAVVLVAGCGDDDTAGSATTEAAVATTAPTSTETTVPATTVPESTVPVTTVPVTTDDTETAATTVVDTVADTVPATTTGSPSGECDALNALVAGEAAMFAALFMGSPDVVEGLIADLPALVAAAQASASSETADDLATMSNAYGELAVALDGVDLTDVEAVQGAFLALPSNVAAGEASENLSAYATDNCGYEPSEDDLFADAPEPPECEVLDPSVAASAAGVEIDVSEVDIGADVGLPGFAVKGCGYGNGDMVLSTMTFNSLESIVESYPSNVENNGGSVLTDVDLATLPATSLVTDQVGQISVAVFEADVPFIVGFSDGVEPARVVAAAEAILAGM